MIFVDSNIPMYLIGPDGEMRTRAAQAAREAAASRARLVTDVEVLQEILHRYASVRLYDRIQPAFDLIDDLVDDIFDVTRVDLELAKTYVLAPAGLRGRDAVHRAVMANHGVSQILSFDRHFLGLPGIVRLPQG